MSFSDPYSTSADEMRWKLRAEWALAISDPRSHIALSEEEAEMLPGNLGRLARDMHRASGADEARAAANAFLIASEEWL